jgi:hypothetical protein
MLNSPPPSPSPIKRGREYFGKIFYCFVIEGRKRETSVKIMIIAIKMISRITKGIYTL